QELDAKSPLLVIADDVVPDPARLRELLAGCRNAERPTTWVDQGRAVATYYPEAKLLLDGLAAGERRFPRHALGDPRACAIPAPVGAFDDVSDSSGIARTERRILAALGRPGDGYLARLDRAVSIRLSRGLVQTRITPHVVTGLSLALGLAGAGVLAAGGRWMAVVGAALLWLSAILDGCDGEVARLKGLASPTGARLDTITDHLTHLATFSAIALHLHRARPHLAWGLPAGAMLAGVVGSMLTVARVVNRQEPGRRRQFARVGEPIASRDYIYLVLALTALGRLEWLVWCAAVGANVFWIGLCGWAFTRRAR